MGNFRLASILEQEVVTGPFSQVPPVPTRAHCRCWELKEKEGS